MNKINLEFIRKMITDGGIIEHNIAERSLKNNDDNSDHAALAADLASLLFRIKYNIKNKNEIQDRFQRVWHDIIQKLEENPTFQKVRSESILDPDLTEIGVKGFYENICREIAAALEKKEQQRKEGNSEKDRMGMEMGMKMGMEGGNGEEEGEGEGEGGSGGGENGEEEREEDGNTENLDELDELTEEELSHIMDSLQSPLQRIHNMVQKSSDVINFLKVWGTETGSPKKLDLEEIVEISKNFDVVEVLRLAGELFAILSGIRGSWDAPAPQEKSVKLDGNPIRAIPSELVALIVPEMELYFLKKLAYNELVSIIDINPQKKISGPFIICVDESGSMTDSSIIRGIPNIAVAKATALAIAMQAIKEKRKFQIISFSSRNEVLSLEETELKNVLSWVSHFFNGGTDFESPLKKAADFLENLPEFEKADIVFITDGECESPSEEILSRIKNRNTKIIGVPIGPFPTIEWADVNFSPYQYGEKIEFVKDIFMSLTK